MRNSLLAECGPAPIMYGGSSRPPKHGTSRLTVRSGRGVLRAGRSVSVSRRGLHASKNAGISSDKTGGNPVHRKPKVSAARLVRCGSAGPKARAQAVVDGCQVHIPEPGVKVRCSWGRLGGALLGCWSAERSLRAKRRGRHPGREKPHCYDTSDRTANRHR